MSQYLDDLLTDEVMDLATKGMTFPQIRLLVETVKYQRHIQRETGFLFNLWYIKWRLSKLLTACQAVNIVICGELGSRSSLPELARAASEMLGRPITVPYACSLRSKWRWGNMVKEDCRTYRTQFERDMRRADYDSDNIRAAA